MKNATLSKCIILSPDDKRVKALKYKIGDKFLFKRECLDDSWEDMMLEELQEQDTIVEIDSYEINIDGELGYRLSFITQNTMTYWRVPQDMLESNFVYLGKDHSKTRFIISDD